MLKCIELDERLKSMDQEITVNPQFVQKVGADHEMRGIDSHCTLIMFPIFKKAT